MGSELTPDTMVPLMLQSERFWTLIELFVTLAMKTRELDGRRERNNGEGQWPRMEVPSERMTEESGHASTSRTRSNIHGANVMLCIWWYQLGVLYYELLKPNETITGKRYRMELIAFSLL